METGTNEQIIEELVRALQAEKYAYDFFKWAADASSYGSVKNIFSAFAKEEETHQKLIKQQIEKISGDEWDISGFKPEKFPGLQLPGKDELMKKPLTEKDAFSIGIALEKSAIKFYEALQSISSDEEMKKFCLQFINFEKDHLKQLEVKLSEMPKG